MQAHLEASRVGKHATGPVDEGVQAAHLGHQLAAWGRVGKGGGDMSGLKHMRGGNWLGRANKKWQRGQARCRLQRAVRRAAAACTSLQHIRALLGWSLPSAPHLAGSLGGRCCPAPPDSPALPAAGWSGLSRSLRWGRIVVGGWRYDQVNWGDASRSPTSRNSQWVHSCSSAPCVPTGMNMGVSHT